MHPHFWTENCRDMDEDLVTVLGLGHLDMTSGKNSSKGRDESIHGGSATTLSMQAEALSPGVLLQLGNMDEPDPDAAGAVGVGWQVESSSSSSSRLYNAHTQDPVKLGLGSSQNASEYEPCGGERLLGLGNTGEKSANKRSWECPSFGSFQVPVVDEGSSSARVTCGGYMPSLLMGSSVFPPLPSLQIYENGTAAAVEEDFMEQNLSMSFHQRSSTTSTSSRSGHSDRPLKVCKFRGCGKGPRGASGLCIAHGGGRRCQKHGCNKGAEGRTVYCKAHGGGRRCQNLGCTKSAEGKTDYCIGHGGGRRCSKEGCDKAARGRSGLCIRHGGGKRCQVTDCTKSAEGYTGLCISHGGGRRCQFMGCSKGAQGSTMFCKAHGGGKRCIIKDCNKGAEGSTPLCKGHGGGKRCMYDGGGICTKSVHGGTLFCVAHGGGKRCTVEGCGKSARGRTDHCVKHGGGKRCKVDGCGKSAQGSTDFCKAHGGGKRCQWGVEGSTAADSLKDSNGGRAAGAPCDKFARGKSGLCAAHSALVQDRRVHGGGTVGNVVTAGLAPGLFRGLVSGSGQTQPRTINSSTTISGPSTTPVVASSRAATSASDKEMGSPSRRQAAAPEEAVLVPLSMQRRDGRPPRPPNPTSDERVFKASMLSEERVRGGSLMEGRVRGGGLITLLSEAPNNGGGGGAQVPLGTGIIEHMRSRQPTSAEMESQSAAGAAADSNMLHADLTSPDWNGSLGIDVGQFLATSVNFNL
ncbi:unnamed protein product [Sphagnum troendelagicum]|uniref:WRKY19-like zinc finger domain-containing protein n=1 Tax=Sphagnum troendelagicum TaxID=128251 RepID=A0ABP0UEM0_9BRYO